MTLYKDKHKTLNNILSSVVAWLRGCVFGFSHWSTIQISLEEYSSTAQAIKQQLELLNRKIEVNTHYTFNRIILLHLFKYKDHLFFNHKSHIRTKTNPLFYWTEHLFKKKNVISLNLFHLAHLYGPRPCAKNY